MLLTVGCRPIGYAPRLVGTWAGAPETAEQRATRAPSSQQPTNDGAGEQLTKGEPKASPPANTEPAARTALESVEVRVTLDFSLNGDARMWLGDAEDEALSGTWRVVSSERDRALVEIIAKRDREGKTTEEKRRFSIQLLEDDNAFTLAEEGADRFFGRLYFRRQGGDR